MSVKIRIGRLEQRVGRHSCECETGQISYRVIYPDKPEPEAGCCPKCGRELPQIIVRYVDSKLWDAI